MVHVVASKVEGRKPVRVIALWSVLVAGALALIFISSQNSAQFYRWQAWILLATSLGVLVFGVLLVRKILQLVRAYRSHVPGSRLTARTVLVFGLLVVMPLLTVYLFSLEFLNRGIDSWFRVEIKQGLNDALVLSRAALDLRVREHAERTDRLARELGGLRETEIQSLLDAERRASGAAEMVLYGAHERILAASSSSPAELFPARPPTDLLRQVGEGRPYVILEPLAGGEFVIRTAAPVTGSPRAEGRFVVAEFNVPAQLAALAEAVQRSYSNYGDLASLREPLKNSFRLTLTLVLLVTMLAAIYGAIYSAQLLFKPVQDLMEGTRAVAKGDFGTRLPLSSRDEMGFLVQSFNEMTKRLRRAREDTTRSQIAVERERGRLAIILARLSSGVWVVDRDLVLRVANEAARAILAVDFQAYIGKPLRELVQDAGIVPEFVREIGAHLAAGKEEWREQLELASGASRRVLTCACVPLSAEDEERAYLIVFDDITALLQAQRDAAWGEVARRLAHEIKNPLTPIQLSAERMRRRFLGNMSPLDAEILDRATNTIVQQVEAMKQMVNAFSEYARAPDMNVAHFNLNGLVSEVADLYRSQDPSIDIRLDLDAQIDSIEADRGRLRQILNNLVTNAIEALDGVAGAKLELQTRRGQLDASAAGGNDTVVISVIDNGPGFPRELLGRVFDPYVTSKPRGTGLGLAIVKKIVEEHGGRIEADNRTEGGARIRVQLPLNDTMRTAAGRERRVELRRERA